MREIVYYVSGHGYGHARRSTEVLRALLELRHDVVVHVRTTAPRWLFDELPQDRLRFEEVAIDPGAAEDDALNINLPRTLERVRQALCGRPEVVRRESQYVRENRVELIAADVPFLAGEVAEAAGVRAVAVSNFTWDWIYEPWFGREHPELIETIRASYAKFHSILHMPWGGYSSGLTNVVEVPLVVTAPRFSREEVRRRLGFDERPIVLLAMRGGTSKEALVAAARQSPDYVFLCIRRPTPAPENVRAVELSPAFRFIDLLPGCDLVLCKLGYGIVADCIRCRVPLLHPPRTAFREDPLSAEHAAEYINLRPLEPSHFLSGDWRGDLRDLLARPRPNVIADTRGGNICAAALGRLLG